MDMNPVEMNYFIVYGSVLIPDNGGEVNISAKIIWIRGGSVTAGNSSVPYSGKVNIHILGNQTDPGYQINEYIGTNKLFVVQGKLNLYGNSPNVSWSKLTTIIRKGDTTLNLESAVDWQVND